MDLKGKRQIIIFGMIILLGFGSVARAKEPLDIGMDCYVAEDGVLKLYVNHNQGTDFFISNDNIKVMFGNNEMVTQKISTLNKENVPISYKCVVDVSGSMSQERIDEAKAIIKDLATNKKPEDSIAITALGNELIQSEYMTDAAKICEKADYLTLTREDTNLYYAIVQEIKGLQTVEHVNRKKCLIVFSDGADDQATGITKEEAENAVIDSHIPVFTVGLLKSKDNNNSKEMAKILGSFARISSGGEHFAPALGEGSAETIADSIIERLNCSLVLEESLDDVDVSGKEVVLKVIVSTNEGEIAEDSMNVSESDIKIIHAEQQKNIVVPTAEPIIEEPIIEEIPTEEVEEGVSDIIIVAIIVVLLIVILVLFIFVKNKKKVFKEEESLENFSAENNRTMGSLGDEGLTMAPSGYGESRATGKKYKVLLVRLGKKAQIKYDIDLYDTYTIGRSESKCRLALPKDTALSSVHCTLLVKNGKIFIKDEHSTNGTFVNGVPISGNFQLNQDDVILLGSYEYRISWK